MSDQSPRLGLPYVRAGQLQKHVTVNEGLTRLDALVQTAIVSRSLNAPPSLVEAGDMFILTANPSGPWQDFEAGWIAVADLGGWRTVEPMQGQIAVVLDEGAAVVRHSGQWIALSQMLGGSLSVERLGVGATPDAANPFSARLNKALWAARPTNDGGDGDLRFTFNKQTASHTASILFQSNWQGRAEFGLTGHDNLSLKVSTNGTVWREAMTVERTTGAVTFARGATRREVLTLITSQVVELPDWMRWVEVSCTGGGGAGGAGSYGAASVLRTGGGGGGAGGVIEAIWPREPLGDALVVEVGAGGAGATSGDGQAGGTSAIRAHDREILRATGGGGGLSNGTAGAGGLGRVASNQGGACGTDAVARVGISGGCLVGSGGGGGGGGLTAAGVAHNGAAGGTGGMTLLRAGGGGAGTGAGGAGQISSLPALSTCSGGGGGGAARAAGEGHSGGVGGQYGGGGGGGGAGTTGGGAGGAGGAGLVVLTLVG